ncbi:MAG: hypothetical protein J5548_12045 [Prevotella sp.]|nr:hypothetical protein [Prevotella sp.]
METIKKYLTSRNKREREACLLWLTAFGIQSVVDLKPSADLLRIICNHIEGKYDIERTRSEVRAFYHEQHKMNGSGHHHRFEEADKVSVRIVDYFERGEFSLTPESFSFSHRSLFHNLYHHSGQLREAAASKKEWVLGNTSVLYPKHEEISPYLNYLFSNERGVDLSKLSPQHRLRHLSEFIAKLFMINAFQYANSRTTFVYSMKYLMSLGYQLQNDTFFREAWYFRNAIIRACYTNMHQGVYPTTKYMEMFLSNLFLNEENELRNHRMVIRGE